MITVFRIVKKKPASRGAVKDKCFSWFHLDMAKACSRWLFSLLILLNGLDKNLAEKGRTRQIVGRPVCFKVYHGSCSNQQDIQIKFLSEDSHTVQECAEECAAITECYGFEYAAYISIRKTCKLVRRTCRKNDERGFEFYEIDRTCKDSIASASEGYCYVKSNDNQRCAQGSTLPLASPSSPTLAGCAKACNNAKGCTVFSFKISTQECSLNAACTNVENKDGWQTYKYNGLTEVARGRTAQQQGGSNPAKAVDDNRSKEQHECAVISGPASSWWQVDLVRAVYVKKIILNRQISDNGKKPAEVRVSNHQNGGSYHVCAEIEQGSLVGNCSTVTKGRYLRIVKNDAEPMILCDVQVYAMQEIQSIPEVFSDVLHFTSSQGSTNLVEVSYGRHYLCGSIFQNNEAASHLCDRAGFISGAPVSEGKQLRGFTEEFYTKQGTRTPPYRLSQECGLALVEDQNCQYAPVLECFKNGENVRFMNCRAGMNSRDCQEAGNTAAAFDIFTGEYPVCSDGSTDRPENDEVATELCKKNGFPSGQFAEGEILGTSTYKMKNISCPTTTKELLECSFEVEPRYGLYIECLSRRPLRAQCFPCEDTEVFQIIKDFDAKYFPEVGMPDRDRLRQAASETLVELKKKCGNRKCYPPFGSKSYCHVRQLLERLAASSPLQSDAKSRKIIMTQSSHAARLASLQVAEGFSSTIHLLKGLREEAVSFRSELSKYFGTLAVFDREKAQQDRLYIESVIETNNNLINKAIDEIQDKVLKVIKQGIASVSADIGQKTAGMAISVANNLNPVAWATGGVNPLDLLDRADKLAVAAVGVPRLIKVKEKVDELGELAKTLTKGMQTNKKLHEQFLVLIDRNYQGTDQDLSNVAEQFTSSYGSFSPGLTKDLISTYSSTLSSILEEACDLLFKGDTTAGAVVQTIAATEGACLNLKIYVDVLASRLEVADDKQFELMDAGAELARSIVAAEGAKRLQKNLRSVSPEDSEKQELYSRWEVLISSYEHHVVVVQAACDSIEYKRGGSLPTFCKSLLQTPWGSLEMLRTYDFNRKICKSELHPRKAYLPAMLDPSPSDVKSGIINLRELYELGSTIFTIPSKDYLLVNKWIPDSDNQSTHSYYVRQLQLYLPIEAGSFVVELSFQHLDNANRLFPKSSLEYIIPGTVALHTHYEVGEQNCFGTVRTPYQVPHCPKPTSVCMLRSGALEAEEYLPTVYGAWLIKLANADSYGLKKLRPPPIVGTIHLQAAVDICSSEMFNDDKSSQRRSGKSRKVAKRATLSSRVHVTKALDNSTSSSKRDVNYCCMDQRKHWSVKLGKCVKCPLEGKPSYDSYYCEEKSKGKAASPSDELEYTKAKSLLCNFLKYGVPSLANGWCE